ncbi:FAD-dependent oxidoreductase [Zavarzinia aquatilis]|nr:FAD-dependent oxidoreductase [Zavarzinia aquatilis]
MMGFPAAWAAGDHFHVVVYGATSAGVHAAYAAAREGFKVAIVVGPNPIGGMTANGLGHSDVNQTRTLAEQKIGGLTAAFFKAMGRHYGREYSYHFEPSVAEAYFRKLIDDADISVYYQDFKENKPLKKDGQRIKYLLLEDGTMIVGQVFIDCSYEGDLMAAAGVSYDVGRDSGEKFGESLAGFGVSQIVKSRIKVRDSAGRLLPWVKPFPPTAVGGADLGVMGYNYRLCMTNDPHDRLPLALPAVYNKDWYKIDMQRGKGETFNAGTDLTGTSKVDRNSDEPTGPSWNYPRATRANRKKIAEFHKNYQAGRLYFLATDPSVAKTYRDSVMEWGLARSEFTDNGHWPRQLYVREARRLRGIYKVRQQDCSAGRSYDDGVFWWAYPFDSHSVQYLEGPSGELVIEGAKLSDLPNSKLFRYQMPLRAMMPLPSQCSNLIVPVCASVTRIANTSYRMEAAYMMAGEAAGIVAAKAGYTGQTVQSVSASYVISKLKGYGALI